MSAKVISKGTVGHKIPQSNIKAAEQKKSIKDCLKLLESNQLNVQDVEGFSEEFILKPQLGDHMQFELHKYCLKDSTKTNGDLVIKLSELCYSKASVAHFSNVNRFVGCVYHISSFLLKKEKYKSAIKVTSSLLLKKNEILEFSKEKQDIRTFLCNLHGSFIASALVLESKVNNTTDEAYEICHNLVMESLNILSLIGVEQKDIGKKVLKTTFLYLQTIQHYTVNDILHFYRTLRGILTVLLPQIGDTDYFLIFIHKMTQLKKSDSDKEIYQILKKTVHFLTIFLNSSSGVTNILYKALDFFWSDSCLNGWVKDEELATLNEDPSHSVCYFLLFSNIFSYGMQFLWTKFEKSWCESISTSFVEKLSLFVMSYHKSHCGSQTLYCQSVKGPFEICFGDLLTGNLQKIQYTVRLCLKNKIPNALLLVPVSREAFELSMQCLRNMESFGCSKEHTTYSWKFSVIHHTNTVEDICKFTPSDESWSHLKECSQEILREIVNSNMELPFDFPRVKILFQRWHTGTLRLKNYQEALYACLVYYVFYPKEERDIMYMWLQTKSESSNEIFEEITMPEIFKTCDKSLKEFNKNYNRSNVCHKSALLMELKAYSTCLPDTFVNPNTAYNLATKIWKLLEKFKLDLWESSLAMSFLISASIAGENENLPGGFHEKCQKHIDDLINSNKNPQCRNLLHAANLIFSLFLYNVKMAERSEGKMDTAHMVLGYLKKAEQEKVKFGEDVDLNLTCDVIPSSKHLTVELETNYLNELNKIVDLWNSALKSGMEDLPSSSEFDLWLRNVKQVAYLYELNGEYQRAFTTWTMFYRIGKLSDNSGAILLGLTHLIENCADVDESGVKEEAELITEKLGSEARERYVLVQYSLAVASNYLKNKKSNKCLEYLSIAKKIVEGLRTTITTYTLNAKFWCLVSQFLVVYREYEAVFGYPKGTDVRVMVFRAFSYANGGGRSELIRSATQSECTELVLAMLEVSLWAYHLHGVYRQTDFMRFFLDDLYQIAQKLFLPTRTAEMLVRLAEVDMICEKSSDCQEKVLKLKSILTTLSPSCGREMIKPERPTSPYLSVPQGEDLEGLRPISPARFLDSCPQPKEIDVSPVRYYLSETKISKTQEHTKKCKCRLCQNLLIQILTFDTIWLEAEMQNLNRSLKEAAKCYSQACEVLNKVEHVRDEQSKILRLESASVLNYTPGELDFKLRFVQFHCARFLIKYALFESSSLESVTENVTKTILRISKLVKKFSYEEKLLQWTFTELKLYCVVLSKGVQKPPKSSSPVVFKTTTIARTPLISVSVGKTPALEKTNKKFTKSKQPCAQPKRILFEDAPSPNKTKMNTGFVEEDEAVVSRPRKLNFLINEPEVNSKTVKKAAKEKPGNIQSRKLDFDVSADLFEDEGKKETPLQTRTLRQSRKAAPTPITTKKETKQKPVKIYLDSKDEKKSKKSGTKKVQTRKTTN